MAGTELVRQPRRVRFAHAAVYLTGLPLLGTGWWLVAGGEGNPSPLARVLGVPDARLPRLDRLGTGRGHGPDGPRRGAQAGALARETLRADRGDGRWWLRWPAGAFTGRFARHEGRFDPGQRVANVVLIGGLFVLVVTGVTMTMIHGGPVFVWTARIHRWTTFVITPVILGHVLIAAGAPPGYRGVWRSMHLGGRVPEATARRVWPGWTERAA